MSSPLVLALDLSTRTGWALGRWGEAPRSGVWMLGKMAGGLGRILSGLAGELEDALQVFRPDLVIMEAPLPPAAQTAMATARLQFGLAAVVEMIAEEQTVPCEEERADTVRKLVLGSGRASKEQIVAWAKSEGLRPADDNEADALCLLRYRQILGRSRVMAGAGAR